MRARPIVYVTQEDGSIVLPPGPPFDGNPVLIKTKQGWVEAWWENLRRVDCGDTVEYEGFLWICLDDTLQKELEEIDYWAPLPGAAPGPKAQVSDSPSLISARIPSDFSCCWVEDTEGTWASSCGHLWQFTSDGPAENEMQFCCFCGRKLAAHAHTDFVEDEDDGLC